MITHELRIERPFFEAVKSGEKTFELRQNDRGFQKGDRLLLKEIDDIKILTGRGIFVEVTYILNGWGLLDGFVAMAIKRIEPAEGSDE